MAEKTEQAVSRTKKALEIWLHKDATHRNNLPPHPVSAELVDAVHSLLAAVAEEMER